MVPSFIVEGEGNALGVSSTSPNGADAQSNAGYLVQLEKAEADNQYYLKSGLGNYYANATMSRMNPTSAEVVAKYAYTIAQLGSAGHWSLRSNGMYYLQNSNGKLIGASSVGGAGSDRDWVFRKVTFSDLSDLTGFLVKLDSFLADKPITAEIIFSGEIDALPEEAKQFI